jgi:hypothetical protein
MNDIVNFLKTVNGTSESIIKVNAKRVINIEDICKGCTMRGVSREMILRNFGEDVADEFKCKIERIIIRLIQKKGYATEKEIIRLLKGNKFANKTKIKRVLYEILYENKLKCITLNAKLKYEYKINITGYPYIIIKDYSELYNSTCA